MLPLLPPSFFQTSSFLQIKHSKQGNLCFRSFDAIVDAILAAGQGAYLSKFDVKSAFRLLAVRAQDMNLQVVLWRDKYCVDMALVFGARSSPPAWDRVASALSWILLHNYGIRNVYHVDDFLMIHPASLGPNAAQQQFHSALGVCRKLKIPISIDKSQGPAQEMTHVGLLWNTVEQTVTVTEARRTKAIMEINDVLTRKRATAKAMLSLHGRLTFISRVLFPARAFMYYLRHRAVRKSLQADPRHRARHFINISKEEVAELEAWLRTLRTWKGSWLLSPTQWPDGSFQTVWSDACKTGLGAYSLDGRWANRPLSHGEKEAAMRDETLSMPYLEMSAAVWAIKNLTCATGQYSRVVLWCDCEPVVNVINNGGGGEEGIAGLMHDLCAWCVSLNVYVVARHLSSAANWRADPLSRLRTEEFVLRSGFRWEDRVDM